MPTTTIQWIPSPNHFAGRNGHTPAWLILHGTAGFHTALEVGNYFQDPASQVSAHYVIGQDGSIVQCVDEKDAAWGNGVLSTGHDPWWDPNINPNFLTISIEHVKPHIDNSDQLTPAQQQASFQLVRAICERYGIPRRWADSQGGITGHFSIDPVSRSRCPGPYPWHDLFADLMKEEQGGDMAIDINTANVKNYFTEKSATQWTCNTTSHDVHDGILTFYKHNNGLMLFGLPITDEQRAQGVTYQVFERAIIVYDPTHKLDHPPGAGDCYTAHINTGLGYQLIAQATHTATVTTPHG